MMAALVAMMAVLEIARPLGLLPVSICFKLNFNAVPSVAVKIS